MKKILAAILVSTIFGMTSFTGAVSYRIQPQSETQIQYTQTASEPGTKTTIASPYKNMSYEQLYDFVNTIGNNIVRSNNINKNIKFKVNMEQMDNAYTDIEDTVTVYKGLVECCETPDELAFVIGHELGHASQNHVIKTAGANAAGNIAVNAATYATSVATKESAFSQLAIRLASFFSSLFSSAAQNKYSRTHEFDADIFGIDYMVKAGYNPMASISIMNKIGENYQDFWLDHPSTDKRLSAMKAHIKKNYPKYMK